MVKDILKILLNILVFVIIIIFQIFVANNAFFFGVSPNLIVVFIAIIAMLYGFKASVTIGVMVGVFTDILFYTTLGKYTIIFTLITIMVSSLKKIYKEDNKISVIIVSVLASIICEIGLLIFNLFLTGNFVNIIHFAWNTLKLSLVNICFAYVIYLLLKCIHVKKESRGI